MFLCGCVHMSTGTHRDHRYQSPGSGIIGSWESPDVGPRKAVLSLMHRAISPAHFSDMLYLKARVLVCVQITDGIKWPFCAMRKVAFVCVFPPRYHEGCEAWLKWSKDQGSVCCSAMSCCVSGVQCEHHRRLH